MARSDVLVCGQCHNVYHFIQEFAEHRNAGGCSLESTLRENVCYTALRHCCEFSENNHKLFTMYLD